MRHVIHVIDELDRHIIVAWFIALINFCDIAYRANKLIDYRQLSIAVSHVNDELDPTNHPSPDSFT